MAVLKSNLCPTCGGLLDIDLDKQMYVCTFCGVSFDYEYFREENVKEIASKALLRSEFGSAKDAYEFMLTKDPHDFEALRGLFLCKVEWQDMTRMKKESEVKVSADEPALLYAIENCDPEDKPYFEKVREALKELHHYRDLTAEAKKISEKRDETIDALHNIEDELYTTTHLFKVVTSEIDRMEPKSRQSAISLALVVPLFVLMVVVYSIMQHEWKQLIVFAITAVVIIACYHLIKFIIAKYLTKSMEPYKKERAELTDQLDAKNTEAKQSIARYNELVQEFMDMDS